MIYITKTKSISSDKLRLVDHLYQNTYVHSVLNERDMKLVDRGIKNKFQIMVDKLFETNDFGDTFTHSRSGLIYAAGNTTSSGFLCELTKMPDKYPTTKNHALSLHNILMGYVANRIGIFDHLSVDGTACTSSTAALKYAQLLIKSGELDRVLVVSAEDGSSNELIEFFCKNKICNIQGEDRGTFYLGEGASYTLLENEESITETGNQPIAELVNVSTFHEQYSNPIGISSTGEGYKRVIKDALDSTEDAIDIIRLHDTGTDDNIVELELIADILPSADTVSYKKRIGHTLGSSSGIELDLALREHKGVMMHLSAGMGNVFGSILTKTL